MTTKKNKCSVVHRVGNPERGVGATSAVIKEAEPLISCVTESGSARGAASNTAVPSKAVSIENESHASVKTTRKRWRNMWENPINFASEVVGPLKDSGRIAEANPVIAIRPYRSGSSWIKGGCRSIKGGRWPISFRCPSTKKTNEALSKYRTIQEKENDVINCTTQLKMYASSNPKDIVPAEWNEEPIRWLNNQIEDLVSEIVELTGDLVRLGYYRNNYDNKPTEVTTEP